MRFSQTLAAAAVCCAASVAAISQIGIKDRHFVNSTSGEPFFVRGVDYQPGGSSGVKSGSDPLSDPDALARDIYLFQRLGINTIRVYSVDPTIDHDESMTMLAEAGIYLVLDVNSPLEGQHLNAQVPWTTYTPAYLNHLFTVLEVFAGYDNLLGVLAGNEVVFEDGSSEWGPQYVKAVVRDLKDYMKAQMSRQIPVGYSNADVLDFRVSMADYLQCGPEEEAVDFFGVNSYQWCGPEATFETSGYNTLVEDYQNYSIPLFFTEFGCNDPAPRVFNEVIALYSEQMTGVFSGGLVYEMTQEGNKYGLVTIGSDGSATMNGEYDALKSQYAKAATPTIPSNATKPARPTVCASSFPNINGSSTLPNTLGADLIKNGISGEGSTWTKGKFLNMASLPAGTNFTVIDSAGKKIPSPVINAVAVASSTQTGGAAAATTSKAAAGSLVLGGMNGGPLAAICWSLGMMGIGMAVFL